MSQGQVAVSASVAATVCLIFGGLITSSAQAPPRKGEIRSTINAAAAQFFRETPQAAGLSIGFLGPHGTYTFNYGRIRKGNVRRPTANTLYQLASITKTFTGTLLAQAALEGRVDLGDDVRKYLDGEYSNLEFEGHAIRLYDLLDHRSGLPFFMPDTPETQPDTAGDERPWVTRITDATQNYKKADFMADLHKVKLTAVPGDTFVYSNTGAQLAAYVLERIYAVPFATLLNNKILLPLKMRHSAIILNEEQRSHLAVGYNQSGQVMDPISEQCTGAAGIKSSVSDMLKYERWQIAEQDLAVKLSHRPVFTSGGYAVGLNWQMVNAHGKRLIWQEGNIDGYNSLVLAQPESKIALVVLANEEDHISAHNLSVMTNRILRALDSDAILLP